MRGASHKCCVGSRPILSMEPCLDDRPDAQPDAPTGSTVPASEMTLAVTKLLQDHLSGPPEAAKLEMALRMLAKWRSVLVANTLVHRSGHKVLSGPFKGMDYSVAASEGAKAARLLGSYEITLAPVIETAVSRRYKQIIDVGCAEGYYAVGMALRLPRAKVWARDASPAAQDLCREHARRNGVSDRVDVGGLMEPQDFDWCKRKRTLVICDIEGGEETLLDPALAPGLVVADILVECHDAMVPGLTDRIAARFAKTHKVARIGRSLAPDALPEWMETLSDMDRLIALWEWRGGPTPWLWMQANRESEPDA